MVRAKFNCHFIDKKEDGSTVVNMLAVTSGSEENEQWGNATPSGSVVIEIAPDKEAAEKFEQGKDYYLDFTPCEA